MLINGVLLLIAIVLKIDYKLAEKYARAVASSCEKPDLLHVIEDIRSTTYVHGYQKAINSFSSLEGQKSSPFSDITKRLFHLLSQNERVSLLPIILKILEKILHQKCGVQIIKVESSSSLDDKIKHSIESMYKSSIVCYSNATRFKSGISIQMDGKSLEISSDLFLKVIKNAVS